MNINVEEIKQKVLTFIEKHNIDKEAVIYILIGIMITFYVASRLILPSFGNLFENVSTYLKKQSTINQLSEEVERKRKLQEIRERNKPKRLPVKIYKTPYGDMELENAAAKMVNQVLENIRATKKNKILSIDFEEIPVVDNYGVESKSLKILRVKIQMESSYEVTQNFLNDVYLMEYLIRIRTVSLSALEKYNYKRIKAFIELDLFVDIS